ncbi:MAG: hypothetical protein K8I02_06645, partial [Candidatus Methylomirabilis sp.]|nr:hypothetical protein [Deltaproteobacteria bacterium]
MLRPILFAAALAVLGWAAESLANGVLIGSVNTTGGSLAPLAAPGDMDGDGVTEIVYHAHTYDEEGVRHTPFSVLSGATLEPLYDLTGSDGALTDAATIDGVGDVDGDGAADFILGGAENCAGGGEGCCVYSGATGTVLYVLELPEEGFGGKEAAGAGDVDGDGTPDFLCSDYTGGEAAAFSGATGAVIRVWNEAQLGYEWIGRSLAGVGDVDADGYADVGLMTRDEEFVCGEHACAHIIKKATLVLSGATGEVLYIDEDPYYGTPIAGLGDLDGDGHDDFFANYAAVSGRTGERLFWYNDSIAIDDATSVGDVDGDGTPDVMVGGSNSPVAEVFPSIGRVAIYSGASALRLYLMLAPTTLPWYYNPGRVEPLGDLDGDGSPEIAVERMGRFLIYSLRGPCTDFDGDGYGHGSPFIEPDPACPFLLGPDCNDLDPAISPAAEEVCDGQDNDCDGAVDEGFDLDGDGYAVCAGDCDDADPAVHAGAPEVPGNVIDDDCDG